MGNNIRGVPSSYPTGNGSNGRRSSARNLVSDSSEFVSGVSAVMHPEGREARHAMNSAEAATARLTVSPSMKIPTESPAPTQGGGRVVTSRPGRSRSTFDAGAAEELGH